MNGLAVSRGARIAAALLIAVTMTLGGGAAALAEPTAEPATPPYDFGCIDHPPCESDWERAKNGTLDAVWREEVCITYSMPPQVYPCPRTETTSLGINDVQIDAPGDSKVALTATLTVRNVSDADTTGTPTVCIGMFPEGERGVIKTYDCPPVDSADPTQVTHTLTFDPWSDAERWSLYVWLGGGTGSVAVDAIDYTVTTLN